MNDIQNIMHPDILLTKTELGYELKDIKKNMRLILSFDDYLEIIGERLSHPFHKIIKKNNSRILDCTGGFARDAIILSSLDNNVTMLEENPLVMGLVRDAAKRVNDPRLISILNNIKMRLGDCIDFIRYTNISYDYLYFDFMFNVNKKALPSKKDQFLRKIVDNNIARNKKIIDEAIGRVSCKIIIKEHINSNDYTNFDIINTYRGKTVKYHLLDGKNGY